MTSRNQTLIDIAGIVGLLADYSESSSNQILESIATAYGGVFTNSSRNELLRATNAAINGNSSTTSRNGHLKAIAEGLGAPALEEGLSRAELLNFWLLNAVQVLTVWILATGAWQDLGKWSDADNWNDGV